MFLRLSGGDDSSLYGCHLSSAVYNDACIGVCHVVRCYMLLDSVW